MSTQETKVIKFNWSLVNEAAMTEKLRAMSAKGWHLIGFKEPNYLKLWQGYGFIFEKGEPEERVYRTDYRPGSKHKIAEYMQLCEDAGWRNVFSRKGFYIFSAPADLAAHADFFSDRASRIAKLKRIRLRTLIIGVIALPTLFYFYKFLQGTTPEQSSITPMAMTGFVIFIVYILLKHSLAIRALEKRGPQTSPEADAMDAPGPRRLKPTTEWNIIILLTLILMPLGASVMLPDWHWSLKWHVAQGIGLLVGYGVARIFIIWRVKTRRLP
jgi:Protein of unknown function (DUF2812)